MGSLILSSSQDSIICGPRLIQNLLVETPLLIQWRPKNGFAHIIFKSRFYHFQIHIFSLKYLPIIHSAMTAIISRSKLLIFSCVGSLPIITHTDMIFNHKTSLLYIYIYIYIYIFTYMIKHFVYSKSDQSKTIKGSWIFCCAFTIL